MFCMCVPWELNPQPFVLLTQCSTTEPQEHMHHMHISTSPTHSMLPDTPHMTHAKNNTSLSDGLVVQNLGRCHKGCRLSPRHVIKNECE